MARAGLDTARVIEAAARIADAEGLSALTIARLAADLGVRPSSLYNHVDGLPGIERALALRGLALLHADMSRAAVGRAGEAARVAIALAYRAFARAHPGLYAVSLAAPARDDAAHQAAGAAVVEIVMAVLAGFGLPPEDTLHAVRGLRSLIHGFVSLEAAGAFGLDLDVGASFRFALDAFCAGLRHPPTETSA